MSKKQQNIQNCNNIKASNNLIKYNDRQVKDNNSVKVNNVEIRDELTENYKMIIQIVEGL
jgi:hypothetical protein